MGTKEGEEMTDVAEPVPAARSAEATGGREEAGSAADAASFFPLVLRLPDGLQMNEAQFLAFCQENETLRIEQNAAGDLEIMPPAGGETSNRNFDLVVEFGLWVRQDSTGEGFDATGGFRLPNGARRSPDLAWVRRERLDALTRQQTKRFIPLCPDFVLELHSPSDRLPPLRKQMQEYIDNGARLGWLLDPQNRQVSIYRPGVPVEQLDDPATISGEPVLTGFVLDVRAVFDKHLGKAQQRRARR
jgi:Uma2 family endonuclease